MPSDCAIISAKISGESRNRLRAAIRLNTDGKIAGSVTSRKMVQRAAERRYRAGKRIDRRDRTHPGDDGLLTNGDAPT